MFTEHHASVEALKNSVFSIMKLRFGSNKYRNNIKESLNC